MQTLSGFCKSNMMKLPNIGALILIAVVISGCSSITTVRETVGSTGRTIDRVKVQQIIKNKTTSDEIVAWFRTPTSTGTVGNRDFLTFKYCETSASMFVGSLQEHCDILTVTTERPSMKVIDYNLEEGIKTRSKF